MFLIDVRTLTFQLLVIVLHSLRCAIVSQAFQSAKKINFWITWLLMITSSAF